MRPRIALQQIVDPRIAQKGAYHDALFVKRNRVDLLLHEDLGGGFSPPAAHIVAGHPLHVELRSGCRLVLFA